MLTYKMIMDSYGIKTVLDDDLKEPTKESLEAAIKVLEDKIKSLKPVPTLRQQAILDYVAKFDGTVSLKRFDGDKYYHVYSDGSVDEDGDTYKKLCSSSFYTNGWFVDFIIYKDEYNDVEVAINYPKA